LKYYNLGAAITSPPCINALGTTVRRPQKTLLSSSSLAEPYDLTMRAVLMLPSWV
jgi:hypothetical protein